MKKVIALVLCVALLFPLTGCNNNSAEVETSQAKVATWKTAQTITPFFYQDFLPADHQVEISPFTNPGDMKTALLAGSLDMCGTTLVTAITALSKGEPVVVVSGLSNKCSALVVSNGANIESEADLRGKKIAYVPGTMHHLLLLEVLNRNGLDPQKDVELIRIDFFDMCQALAQGTVDAFYSGEPYPSIAVAEGYGKILAYPEDDGFGIINSAMMTTRDMVENNPELIQELVTAHVQATEFINSDRQAWFDKSAEFGTDPDVLDVSLNNIDMFWEMDEQYLDGVQVLAQRMYDQGLVSEIRDVREMFDLSFIQQAKKDLGL